MIKEYLIFWLKAFFFLSGTFLHELSHFIAAKLTGSRVTGFSIIPHLHRDHKMGRTLGYEYGEVHFYPRFKVLNFIVGLAPISLWVGLWFILTYTGIVIAKESTFNINYENLLDPSLLWVWFAIIQLCVRGFPSSVDIKMSIKGLFSFSGFITIAGFILVYIYIDNIMNYKEDLLIFIDSLPIMKNEW
jgi:hypothetical protein